MLLDVTVMYKACYCAKFGDSSWYTRGVILVLPNSCPDDSTIKNELFPVETSSRVASHSQDINTWLLKPRPQKRPRWRWLSPVMLLQNSFVDKLNKRPCRDYFARLITTVKPGAVTFLKKLWSCVCNAAKCPFVGVSALCEVQSHVKFFLKGGVLSETNHE